MKFNLATILGYTGILAMAFGEGASFAARWTTVTTGGTDTYLDVKFVDANHGWIVGSNGSGQGIILYTENGGVYPGDWMQQTTPVSGPYTKVFFISSTEGWVSGASGVLLHTTDAGINWVPLSTGVASNLRSVHYYDSTNGWAVITNQGLMLRLSDWVQVPADSTKSQDVIATGPGAGWAVGTDSACPVMKVVNEDFWQCDIKTGVMLAALALRGGTDYWAVGNAGVICNYSAGSWNTIGQFVTSNNLSDIAYGSTDDTVGWVVGAAGTIVATTNAGQDWAAQVSGETVDLTAVSAYSANKAWAVGLAGTILAYQECFANVDCSGGVVGCVDLGQCDLYTYTCGVMFVDNTPCDDGDACTEGETCLAGVCESLLPVICNDFNACTDDSCDSILGCIFTNNAQPCDDGDACTAPDLCSNGACQPGEPVDCNDNNSCTDDSCDAAAGCVHLNNTLSCDDGNACTAPDQCVNGTCQPGNPLDCDDNNPCTNDTCDSAAGCFHINNSLPCSDGNSCTTPDLCVNGACQSGALLDCDDLNPCTDDTCDNAIGCVNTNNTMPCDDGSACTQNDACLAGMCVGNALNCDDANPCTDDSCDPQTGCVHANNVNNCDDGNQCTNGDTCSSGVCAPGGSVVCDDGNSCTDDSCDPALGCQNIFNQAACDDNNDCTGPDQCSQGNCSGQPLSVGSACANNGLFCDGVETCDGGGNCVSSGSPCLAKECQTCQEDTDSCFDPAGTACGLCHLCDGLGQCDANLVAPVGSPCDDGDVCTRSGICDDAGICRIEGLCDNHIPGCDSDRPEVIYGTEPGETLNCRLPPDAIHLQVAVRPSFPENSLVVPVSIRIENRWIKPLWDLRLLLRLSKEQTGQSSLPLAWAYVPQSAVLDPGGSPVEEMVDGDWLIFNLGALDRALPPLPDRAWDVNLLLAHRFEDRENIDFSIEMMAPCSAAPQEIGCHLGYDERDVSRVGLDMQEVAAQASPLEFASSSTGCACDIVPADESCWWLLLLALMRKGTKKVTAGAES